MKQAEGAREVLVVTGRGNQSFARVPVVREAVRRLLALLSTRGVVAEHSEHSPGSFAVRLAPLGGSRPPARGHDDRRGRDRCVAPPTLDGLSDETRDLLRRLADGTLSSLGVRDPSPRFVRDENGAAVRSARRVAAAGRRAGDRPRAAAAIGDQRAPSSELDDDPALTVLSASTDLPA